MNTIPEFDAALLRIILSGRHAILRELSGQLECCSLRSHWTEGATRHTRLQVSQDCPQLFRDGSAVIRDVHAMIDGEIRVETELFVVDGRLLSLRCTLPETLRWSDSPNLVKSWYESPAGLRLVDRDEDAALGEVIAILARPDRSFLAELPESSAEERYELLTELVPDHGAAETEAGEVLRAALRICSEYDREGCGNWQESPEFFEQFVEYLRPRLTDGTFSAPVTTYVDDLLSLVARYGRAEDHEQRIEDRERLDWDLRHLEAVAHAWCVIRAGSDTQE